MSGFPFKRTLLCVALSVFLPGMWNLSGEETGAELLERARELRSNEIHLESVRLYRAYVADHPGDRDARVELAELLLMLEDPVGAANTLMPILRDDAADAQARRLFEESLAQLSDDAAAEDDRAILQIARLHRFAGDFEKAEERYRRFLELRPHASLARHELAQMLYDTGETEEALSHITTAAEAAEDAEERRDILLKRASWLSYDPERQDEAVEALRSLIREYPEDAEALLLLADLQRYQARYAEARDSYARAIRAGGPVPRAVEGYYLVLLRTRALERARAARGEGKLEEALRLYQLHFKEMEMTRTRLEQVADLEKDGRATDEHRRLAEFYRRFEADTPPEAEIRLEMASVASESGDTAAAIEQTRRAVALRPNDREARMRLARYQTFQEGSIGAAAATLEEIEEEFGPDAEVAALRGDVYRFQGDYVEARNAYLRTLEANPDDERARAGVEAIDSLFVPEFFGGIGFTRDWSSDYDHWNFDAGVRNIFSAIEHRVDAQYRFLYYRQPLSTQNQALENNRKYVSGNELSATFSGPLRRPWSYLAQLGGVFYDHVDGTLLGRLAIGYGGKDLSAIFGFRRREAVIEHYDLSALLDEVRTNDLFAQAIYITPREKVWERWQLEGYGEGGLFDDGNQRVRLIGTILNRTLESEENALKLGVRGLYLNYWEDSPNYFSPSNYWGVGVTGRYDHQFDEMTDGGLTGTALWIEQVNEFDLAVGGYLDRQITDSSRASVRLDYGESTFPDGDIRSFSGRAEVQILF